jgi:outer membrane protein
MISELIKEKSMKKILAMIVVSLFAAAGMAFAQEAAKIGYVDVKKALTECKAGKAAKAQLDKVVQEKQPKVDAEKTKLEAMQAEYEKNVSDFSDKEKQAKQKEFQEKLQAYQKLVADSRKAINDIDVEYSNKIMGNINKIVADMAKAGKYTVIFNKTEGLMLYSNNSIDLTAKVIKKLDEK